MSALTAAKPCGTAQQCPGDEKRMNENLPHYNASVSTFGME